MKLLTSQLLKPRASADITNNYLLTKYKCVGVMVVRRVRVQGNLPSPF